MRYALEIGCTKDIDFLLILTIQFSRSKFNELQVLNMCNIHCQVFTFKYLIIQTCQSCYYHGKFKDQLDSLDLELKLCPLLMNLKPNPYTSRNQPKCNHSNYDYMRLVVVCEYIWDYLQLQDKISTILVILTTMI